MKPPAKTPPVAKKESQVRLVADLVHDRPLVACRFDPTGKFVVSGAQDNLVVCWDVEKKTSQRLQGHESWVRAIGFSPDAARLYTGGYDGRLIYWACAGGVVQRERTIAAHEGWIRALAVSPNGKLLATCGNDRQVKLWDAASGKLLHTLSGHASHVYNVAFHPDGKSLASCDLHAHFKHWDVASGKLQRDFEAPVLHKFDTGFEADVGGARALVFSRDGRRLAAAGMTNVTNAFAGKGDPAVVMLGWDSGKPLVQHGAKEPVSGVAWGVAEHPQGYWIGLSGGGGGGWLYLWQAGQPQEFFKFKLPDTGRDLALDRQGSRVAVAHFDAHLRIYGLEVSRPA